jgi:hypothetical protein
MYKEVLKLIGEFLLVPEKKFHFQNTWRLRPKVYELKATLSYVVRFCLRNQGLG